MEVLTSLVRGPVSETKETSRIMILEVSMQCQFCGRSIQYKRSLVSHELRCKENPSKVDLGCGHSKGHRPWNKGLTVGAGLKEAGENYTYDKVFTLDSSYPRHCLKKRILDGNLIPHTCQICGLKPVWMDKPMPLILDHVNGVNNDNRIENLRFVCSNCDCQLPTYKSRNRKP